jgi:plasmid stabilization system protein ParE
LADSSLNYTLAFSARAQLDIDEAVVWYDQGHINVAAAFLNDVLRTAHFLETNPYLYIEADASLPDVRRAHVSKFPYSLFYTIDGSTVSVLACYHQSQAPKNWCL